MKIVYATPADQYIAEHDDAADTWVLTHRSEFDLMSREAFPPGWRPGIVGSTRDRMEFLNRQAGIRAGFPSWPEWLRTHGLPTPSQERARSA